MYYGENTETREKGIFTSLSEFLPYRAAGWECANEEINTLADARITELKETPDAVIAYMAPMIRTGEDYRYEQVRRLLEAPNV
jgi:hypothetical protein